ncbi:MAG: hypothetical protein RIR97_535 [Pseudomonadota bacterium]
MPLSNLQLRILKLLAATRNPESYIAGSSWLTLSGPRFSNDIDIFHDREETVGLFADQDAEILNNAGFVVDWRRRSATFYQALISKDDETTKLEWVVDSDFRFFPIQTDNDFGYILHPVDLAMNKIMAAAGRREPRDIVDLIDLNDRILPLGAIAWAAVEKSPGFTPEGLLNEVSRNARYTDADFRRVRAETEIEASEILSRLRLLISEAQDFVHKMPTEKVGLLFLRDGQPVQPDPEHLENYTAHSGQRRGHWPTTSEITHEMLKAYLDNSKEQ